MPPIALTADAAGWIAELDFGVVSRHAMSLLERCAHFGPVQVQRAFYPEGRDCCHVYVLHPPGGLVSGDSLTVRGRVGQTAHALVTTPAAGKIYRSRGGRHALQRQRFEVAAGASLEWLPHETIVFDRARVELDTRIDLVDGAAFIGWELLCMGRQAGSEPFVAGRCRQRLELWREGRPLAIERTQIEGGAAVQTQPWGLGGHAVSGTLLATPPPASLTAARALATLLPAEDRVSVTLLDGVLVCRYLGDSAERARGHFVRLWALLRPEVIGRAPCPPRIWAT